MSVRYAVGEHGSATIDETHHAGNVVDFSNRGIGIETDSPLAPGHTLWLLDGTPHSPGIIRWCRESSGTFRSGVEFLNILEETGLPVTGLQCPDASTAADPGRQLSLSTDEFLRRLASIEDDWMKEPGDRNELLPEITRAFDRVLAACADFERRTPDIETVRKARRWFHEKTDAALGKSVCIHRARTWPQGHQGDYKTLEIIYKNSPLSPGFGRLLDRVVMKAMLAGAVRDRIRKLTGFLAEELSARTSPRMLNIACGSCRELMGVVPEISASGAHITCIDSDSDALDFALDRLSNTGIGRHFEFRKYNALRMFDEELNLMEFGRQDVIYSLGLFDYLPSEFLVKMFRALYALLNPGGTFIAAFKDAARYRHQDYHWVFDWDGFQQRGEHEFREILSCAGIPETAIAETRDETGIIVFYHARKR